MWKKNLFSYERLHTYPEVFSLTNKHEAGEEAKPNAREPLGVVVRSFEGSDPIRSHL